MKNFLSERRIDQVMIPGGMTDYLQTLDLAINKPFKDNLHKEIDDYIEHRMVRNVRGNFVKPKLQEVVGWVKEAWSKITDACVVNALRAGYLDRFSSFQETFIAKHDRLRPFILQDLQKQESQELVNNAAALNLNYDDIEEDDTGIIID